MINFFNAKSWPFIEAYKLKDRLEKAGASKECVVFETGFGPSGLPHMGTFGEVFRTALVRQAFERIDSTPTKLICFSDDMDGFRKIPQNVPNPDMLGNYLGMPLTSVPDPFEKYDSFGAHNNAKLREFLDHYGFDYEFRSATEQYQSGVFDPMIIRALEKYDSIMDIMLPTLGAERRKTYSPILPISPATGKVLMTPLEGIDAEKGMITFKDVDGQSHEVSALGGNCKLQWKVDWAMRWIAQGVDYEMCGRDLEPTYKVSSKIARILGGESPENLTYGLFQDERGGKISKSLGNGLTIDDWKEFGIRESMAHFLFKRPTSDKRVHIGTIADSTTAYFNDLARYTKQDEQNQIDNPVWHIHQGEPIPPINGLDFNLITNLASVMGVEDPDILKAKILKSRGGQVDVNHPLFDVLIEKATHYYSEHLKPQNQYRLPTAEEKIALEAVRDKLAEMDDGLEADLYQKVFYTVGREAFGRKQLGDWFKATYEVLFGQSEGPRMGGFTALYGRENMVKHITSAIQGNFVNHDLGASFISHQTNG